MVPADNGPNDFYEHIRGITEGCPPSCGMIFPRTCDQFAPGDQHVENRTEWRKKKEKYHLAD